MSVTETRLITIVQAAEIVGLSRSKLYELLRPASSRACASVGLGGSIWPTSSASSRGTGIRSARTLTSWRISPPPAMRRPDEDRERARGGPTSRHLAHDLDPNHR